MSWKSSFFMILLLAVISNVFWLYKILDIGVTTTYQQDSFDSQSAALVTSKMVLTILMKGMSKSDVIKRLNALESDGLMLIDKEGVISIGELEFHLENDKLIEVK